jgi:hypothetical protein
MREKIKKASNKIFLTSQYAGGSVMGPTPQY